MTMSPGRRRGPSINNAPTAAIVRPVMRSSFPISELAEPAGCRRYRNRQDAGATEAGRMPALPRPAGCRRYRLLLLLFLLFFFFLGQLLYHLHARRLLDDRHKLRAGVAAEPGFHR